MSQPEATRPLDRRREVAEATWRVIAARGLNRASMRAIARELGTSVGVLTHHFPDKDELLLYTFRELVGELFDEALSHAAAGQGLSRLERILLAALPVDDVRAARWRAWLSFLGQTIGSGPLREVERAGNARFRAGLAEEVARLQASGMVHDRLDPAIVALELMALVDGLAIDYLISPDTLPVPLQLQLVRTHLARLAGAGERARQ